MLKVMGHQAIATHSGTDGIVESRNMRLDVIFCDIGLPGIDGYEVAKALKADTERKNAFLIALTCYAGDYDKEREQQAGFDRHLSKPVDLVALERVLAEIL